eukprot:1157737-Pelagomonas_calceolata.AAC.1
MRFCCRMATAVPLDFWLSMEQRGPRLRKLRVGFCSCFKIRERLTICAGQNARAQREEVVVYDMRVVRAAWKKKEATREWREGEDCCDS